MTIKGIVCGLGNPGSRYASTRHNIGFMTIDSLIRSIQSTSGERLLLKAEAQGYTLWEWTGPFGPESWLLIKPMTYMNRSGIALSRVFFKTMVRIEHLLVIHDEVDLPLGKIRIKSGGGLAGHNGLRSIAEELGTRDFFRLRIGVGRPETGSDLAGYVLDRFLAEEQEIRDRIIERAVLVIRSFCQDGPSMAGAKISKLSGDPLTENSRE